MELRLAFAVLSLPVCSAHWCETRQGDRHSLWCASAVGNLPVVRQLIQEGAGLDDGDVWYKTPLIYAAETGQIQVLSLLLEKKAQIDATDCWGRTALMWAAGSGHFDAVELLTHHGADFDPWVLDDSHGGVPFWTTITDSPIRQWWMSQMTVSSLAESTLGNFKTYLAVFTGALLSVLLVLGTRYLKGLPLKASIAKVENYLPVELNRKRGFSRGAQLLIGKARLPRVLGAALYIFRSVEVVTNLVAILGSGLMIVWWPCWLPFVIGGFLAPTLHKNYAVNLTKPILITAVKGPLSALLALLRTFLFGSVAAAVWRDYRSRHPDLGSSLQIAAPSTFWTGWINPEQAQAQVKMHSDWTQEPTQLQATLGRIFDFFVSSVLFLVALYATSLASYLLWFVVRRFLRKQPGAHQAGQLVEADSSFQEDMLGQILAALPEERSWPSEASPEVLWQPERFFDSMVVKLSLHLLAVVMDINTIFTMVSSQRYILSLVLTTIVTQIFVKEILYGSPMKLSHAVRQSAQRGILREDLLKLLEDKASISVLSLVLTTYSFYFCVQAPFQAMALLFSIVLNVYAVTGFIFEQIDLDLARAGEDSLPRTGRALISL